MADKNFKEFPSLQPVPTTPQQVPRVAPRQVTTGVQSGQQLLGTEKVQINSSDGNIIINDGSNNRIIIGYQQGGF